MDLYIRDTNFNIIKVIRNADSVVWQKMYNDVGQCAISIPTSPELFNVFVNNYFITRNDDDMVCQIKQINIITNTDDNTTYFSIVGVDVLNVLSQRIIWKQENFNGTVENTIRMLIDHNMLNTANYGGVNRQINSFVLGDSHDYTERLIKQVTYDNLLETVLTLCKTYGYGIKVVYDELIKKFVIDLYKGVDRSETQTENPFVVFNEKNHNLRTSNYLYDTSAYKNMALVGGKGEGVDRKLVPVNDSLSGLNRYEVFVDASGLEETTEYNEQLNQHGVDSLVAFNAVEEFTGEVTLNNLYKYKTDFYEGDIVSISNNLGISTKARIKLVKEAYDINGYEVIIEFEY